jgi:hypothetical protein
MMTFSRSREAQFVWITFKRGETCVSVTSRNAIIQFNRVFAPPSTPGQTHFRSQNQSFNTEMMAMSSPVPNSVRHSKRIAENGSSRFRPIDF